MSSLVDLPAELQQAIYSLCYEPWYIVVLDRDSLNDTAKRNAPIDVIARPRFPSAALLLCCTTTRDNAITAFETSFTGFADMSHFYAFSKRGFEEKHKTLLRQITRLHLSLTALYRMRPDISGMLHSVRKFELYDPGYSICQQFGINAYVEDVETLVTSSLADDEFLFMGNKLLRDSLQIPWSISENVELVIHMHLTFRRLAPESVVSLVKQFERYLY